jgi:hypothetical protein
LPGEFERVRSRLAVGEGEVLEAVEKTRVDMTIFDGKVIYQWK